MLSASWADVEHAEQYSGSIFAVHRVADVATKKRDISLNLSNRLHAWFTFSSCPHEHAIGLHAHAICSHAHATHHVSTFTYHVSTCTHVMCPHEHAMCPHAHAMCPHADLTSHLAVAHWPSFQVISRLRACIGNRKISHKKRAWLKLFAPRREWS